MVPKILCQARLFPHFLHFSIYISQQGFYNSWCWFSSRLCYSAAKSRSATKQNSLVWFQPETLYLKIERYEAWCPSAFTSNSWGVLSWQVQHLPPAQRSFNSLSANLPGCAQMTFYRADGWCWWWVLLFPGWRILGNRDTAAARRTGPFSEQRGRWDLGPCREQQSQPPAGKSSFFWAKPSFLPRNSSPWSRGKEGLLLWFRDNSSAGINPTFEPAGAEGTAHSQWC